MNTHTLYKAFAVLLATVVLVSCANRGSGPQGGPKDENPPVVLQTIPEYGAVNVDTTITDIHIKCDELVAIKDAYKHVVVSPPMKNKPSVRNKGKEAILSFVDTLKPNTTYTVYFGDAIVDNNESNPMRNYQFVFSTGNHVDSLYIDGYVIDAGNLARREDIIVGIYANAVDTTFTTTPFMYVAKTDTLGYFKISNIPDDAYNIFALNDVASSWYYSQKAGGEVAFLDEQVRPKIIENGKLKIESSLPTSLKGGADSIVVRSDSITPELLNSLTLRLFKEENKQEYFKKAVHPNRESFTLIFGHEPTKMPELKVLGGADSISHSLSTLPPVSSAVNFQLSTIPWLMEKIQRRDSLVYWITDTTLLKSDTLRFEMKYLKTDSVGNLAETIDTLKLVVPQKKTAPIKKKKKSAVDAKVKRTALTFEHNIREKMEIPDTITLKFAEPIDSIAYDSISLCLKEDTLFTPVPISFEIDDSVCTKQLRIIYEKDFGQTYKLTVDSASVYSIYGRHNDKFYKTFTLNKLETYSNLYITFPENPEHAILELLDLKNVVKYRSVLEGGEVTFQDIKPDKYVLRMIIDTNSNGKWDTGDISQGIQPEIVYYCPKLMNLPANWDVEELWDYKSINVLEQRPEEIGLRGNSTGKKSKK
ncbi:MAG: Ig-like domain-containing protein [Paludibacteraceae bacterium]|nr:Ig-like domain-containing protein [Paludibacteraceae bacterium]